MQIFAAAAFRIICWFIITKVSNMPFVKYFQQRWKAHKQKKGAEDLKSDKPYVQHLFNAKKHIASLKQMLYGKEKKNKHILRWAIREH